MPTKTLSTIEKEWPLYRSVDALGRNRIREGDKLSIGNSRSGSAMTFLQGIEVMVNGKWLKAHISLPPDKTGLGTVAEGHLKIEGGKLLNQYFFEVVDTDGGNVNKIANSKTVKTGSPGKWSNLDDELWQALQDLLGDILFA